MNKATLAISSFLILILGLLQFQISSLNQSNFGATIPTVVALFESSLSSKITSSASTATLVSGTDKQGNSLSGTYGFIIDEGSANEEFVICSATGTALSGCTRGISVTDGKTAVTALQKEHRRGASVKITNYPQLAILSRILNGTEKIPNRLAYETHPSFVGTTASTSLASRFYVDSVAVAGCPNADLTTQGCSELATVSELNAGTGFGATGARLFVNPSYLASSNYSSWLPSSAEKLGLAGTLASLSASNKVLSKANIFAGTGLTLTNKLLGFTLTASAQGDILYRNSAGAYVNLPLGTAGRVLVASSSGNPAWDDVTKTLLVRNRASATGDQPTAATHYCVFFGDEACNTTQWYGFAVPFDGTLTNFRIRTGTGSGTGQVAVQVNGSDSTLLINTTFTSTTTYSDTDSVNVSAGDTILLRIQDTDGGNDPNWVSYSVELRPR